MLDNLFTPTHLVLFVGIAAFWIFVLYAFVRGFRALLNIERSMADMAEAMRSRPLK